ncbi:threonine synthase [Verrucomicrobiales bacterium]|nr:threonine synthase [Verrucomicrobiales bacterium]MDC0291789.1 threonine synthase [Verrucomicrobiales bacterium]MDC0311832.1 threonine synthase [bacterium]
MKYVSTRGAGEPVGFFEAFSNGLAPDGGLYVPQGFPFLPSDLLTDEPLPYPALAWDFLSLYDSDHEGDDLIKLVDESYGDFSEEMSAPLTQLSDNLFILELFHGPTLAFKDFGLQLVGNLFEEQIKRTGESINVLGATSGDTGSAAIHGLAGKDGVNVFVLYPEGRISKLQERQMTCTGAKNIFPIPIKGTFDDAQAIVKELMGDLEFKDKMNLSAINSINIARVLAQSVYYIHAFMQLPPENKGDVNFVVPTGNFGNVFAGWMAHKMGLPVEQFVVATNRNDMLYNFFNSGLYEAGEVSPSFAPSMDIQVASNFERFLFYHTGKDAGETVELMAKIKTDGKLNLPHFGRDNFTATKSTDDDILRNIAMVKEKYDYVIDPHTACGFQDLDQNKTNVVLATAHPAKFPEVTKKAIGEIVTEESLEALKEKTQKRYPLDATAAAVRAFVEKNAAE